MSHSPYHPPLGAGKGTSLRHRDHRVFPFEMTGRFALWWGMADFTTSRTAIERGTDWLARGGLRPTRQRVALAALLVGDGKNRHVTAESLFALAVQANDRVSLATVYNTLRAFCEAGLMQEVVVDGARSYFDTKVESHPHFFWEDTSELFDAPSDQLQITRLPDAPEGGEIARVDVVIRLKRA